MGRGRGKGTVHVWDDDVLDQALAVHYLLTDHGRADDALLCLWFSGYPVDAERAKKSWISHLERQSDDAAEAASNLADGYLGVGKNVWRFLGKPESVRDFIVGLAEFLFDDSARDDDDHRASAAWIINGAPQDGRQTLSGDDAYKLATIVLSPDGRAGTRSCSSARANPETISEAIERCLALVRGAIEYISDADAAPQDRAYKIVDRSWESLGTGLFLTNRAASDFVQSMTANELNETRASLSAIRSTVGQCLALTNSPMPTALHVRVQNAVLGSLGHYFALQLVALGRVQPNWPMAQTILALRDFAMRVQSTDIARKDNKYSASAQVIREWTTTREQLSQLWAAVTKTIEN